MVVGMGRMTAPSSFVKACDEFLPLESMFDLRPQAGEGKEGPPSPSIETTTENKQEGRELLMRAAKQAADSDGIVRGADLGIMLKRIDPKFSTFHYGAKRLSEFIALYPDVLLPTGKRSGLDPTYRVVAGQPTDDAPGITTTQS